MPTRDSLMLCAVWLTVGCREAAGEERPLTETARPLPGAVEPARAASPPAASGSGTPAQAVAPAPSAGAGAREPRCREQPPQDFLLRKHQLAIIGAPKDVQNRIEDARRSAVAYRTRLYGRVPGFGKRSDNAHSPSFYAKRTTFMGLALVLNEKVIPALRCVEAALLRECKAPAYRPKHVGGLRVGENTFKDYEVSNHLYGIAIDIDSDLNPCCGCVDFWKDHPACKKKVASPFERMAMPKCWVDVFERHGFYWLGHDELEDTMHFEFLGDPAKVME
jgi:hypothetical protein